MKHLNAILKNFAAALELLFMPIAGFLFFGFPINFQTVLSLVLIWTSMYIYARNPIQEDKPKEKNEQPLDKKPLLDSSLAWFLLPLLKTNKSYFSKVLDIFDLLTRMVLVSQTKITENGGTVD